jgi:hypothetical protein
MDYDALAKQYGGADAAPVVDYDALAKQYGGADMPSSSGIPGSRRAPSALKQFGRSAASLADVTVGGVIPGAVQYLAYPFARVGRSPEEAQAITQGLVSAVDKPFGKTFGVTETPEYKQEAGRQITEFIGQNFQKGAKWISEKTGLPEADVESYLATATLTAPKVIPPVARAVTEAVAPVVQDIKAGVKMPFEPMLQKGRERRSAESYAKAPQLDAAAEAQRLKIAINPADIDPSASTRFLSAAAGPRGPEALASVNKPRVNEIAKNEMGLDATTQLNNRAAFNKARAQLAGPYEQVKKLPIQQADNAMIQRLEDIRTDLDVIGAKEYAPAISKIVDDAIAKTQTGLTGEALLKNISVLRERARKTYNNKSATTEALDIADTNLKVATELESMIDNSIFNPKLLGEFREARQKMARTYAYEGATDFNTGMVDVSKLARMTAKDSALTGDIASLGKIAGNFPDVFDTKAASKFYDLPRLSRSGVAGGGGALIGSQFGLTGSIVGGLAGSALGEFGGALAAKRMASPGYQAGLKLQDFRIPTNQLAAAAAPIPQNQAVVPFDPRNALVNPTEIVGYAQDGSPITAAQAFSRPNFIMTRPGPEIRTGVQTTQPQLAAPSAEGTINALRAEDARRASMSRTLGQQAEAQQAAAEAAARKPASREVILDFDPITNRMRESSQGIKGATPETFQKLSSLDEAAKKVTAGKLFDLTADEKVAWSKATVDIKELGTGYNKLDDKAIAQKMMDRKWIAEAYAKAREKAAMFEEIAQRASNEQTKYIANVKREQMLDLLSTLEDNLRAPRPTSAGGQGPKTREAIRNKLVGGQNQNALNEPVRVEIRGFGPDKP